MYGRLVLTGVVMTALLSVVGLRAAEGCDCQVNWTAGSRPEHGGCTAGPISAGAVSYAGGTLWRGHNAAYTKGSNSDVDCRENVDCSFTDVAEDSFTCSWKIQVYEGGQWVDAGTISANCTGANWGTTAYEPGKEYRAKCATNDTSADGPYGDDAVQYRYSAGQTLWAPTVTNFHNTVDTCPGGGVLHLEYEWDSSCGHVAHLDKVTVREKVTYEPAWTSGGLHDMSHDEANCFTVNALDPGRAGVEGSIGTGQDNHGMPSMDGTWASYCQASQVYQWATGWLYPPSSTDEGANWQTLATYTIKRYVVNNADQQHLGWWYKVTKGSWGPCWLDLE